MARPKRRHKARVKHERLYAKIREEYRASAEGGEPGEWTERKEVLASREYNRRGGKWWFMDFNSPLDEELWEEVQEEILAAKVDRARPGMWSGYKEALAINEYHRRGGRFEFRECLAPLVSLPPETLIEDFSAVGAPEYPSAG